MTTCNDCGAGFEQAAIRGRPRIRCEACSPPQRRPAGSFVTDRSRSAVCANPQCARPYVAAHGSSRYCCAKCGNAVSNRAGHARRRDFSLRLCGFCGVSFSPVYGDRAVRYCSARCRIKAGYAKKVGSTHRRRARKFGVRFDVVDKLAVFERDGWRCQICGRPTPKDKRGTRAPNAPQLDHRVPMRMGGEHGYDNLQCCCSSCNLAKGARSCVGQLPLFAIASGIRAQ